MIAGEDVALPQNPRIKLGSGGALASASASATRTHGDVKLRAPSCTHATLRYGILSVLVMNRYVAKCTEFET